MKQYRADLHIHTVLSPCGSLEMSPVNIINEAIAKQIDVIAITDHNSMRQCSEVVKLGNEKGIMVIRGAEIATREEVHCLAFFENNDGHEAFQLYLDEHLPGIPNHPEKFGYQVWVDRDERILGEESRYLLAALDVSIDEVAAKVKELNGLFVPAHIDRARFSIISQLGFISDDLPVDALEVSRNVNWQQFISQNHYLANYTIIGCSDAHMPQHIGTFPSVMAMEDLTFDEIRKAFHREGGRSIKPEMIQV